VLLPVRLLFSAGELGDRADEFIVPALIVFAVWAVLWRLSVWYQRTRPPKSTGRGWFRRS
jgi:hypothetical protein